ncbi:hypothetical protein DL95DRAFT_424516 [Leptodontidium sp. 2 PMI_412]|nr:hypothetical protein DL95DRAFT_424516 [Leptodontidium sp. 2 PMI_412]
MKGALVERWKHNLRNPMDLEAFSGVEVSLCTRNARRRRLLHLLGSPTMHNYLRGISFSWISESCEYAYLKALRSPKHFRRFWKALTSEHLDNVGDAISKCLDALEETGMDDDSREIRGLWVESFDTEGDSDGESDNGSDRGEKSTPPPFTALKLEPVSNSQTTVWDAKELKKGTSFCLGDHGSLKVLTAASRTSRLKEAKNVAINEKMLGRPKEKHHREYIRGKWGEKPLPVLVLSKSNKVLFSK